MAERIICQVEGCGNPEFGMIDMGVRMGIVCERHFDDWNLRRLLVEGKDHDDG